LAAIEKAIDKKREDLHIPGASLIIVKDDKVIYVKGFGLRDVTNKLPVTPNTQFAIGSSTKAFTAMTAMMSVDDGKLALTDPPRKYVPYFKMRDAETDSKITISDLLSHRSGLDRTDIAWYTGKLNTSETIRLVSQIKPTAKLGEKFQYQNVMFLVAGECVGAVQHAPWRTVVAKRIFKPLHMMKTNTSIHDMVRSQDHAIGYTYDAAKKESVVVPYHELPAIAPAGAINSNATEMAQWLRLMLGGGVFEGKRLVSEASFQELFKKRITVGGGADYGYGWFLRDWNGHFVAEHGGNIDGFNAQVALMPDQKLGFVLLTNVSASALGTIAMDTIWDGLVGAPKPAAGSADGASIAKVAPELESGTYRLSEASVDIVIAMKSGKLTLTAAAQPEIQLENVSGRRYKGSVQGIEVFVTFRAPKDDPKSTELYLEQPGGKFVCKRTTGSEDKSFTGPLKELIGTYRSSKLPVPLQVSVRAGKVALIVPGQPAYPLNPKAAKDEFSLGGLSSDFAFNLKRDAAGKIVGALLKQPTAQGDMDLVCELTAFVPPMPIDTLMDRVIEAMGGAANLQRHKSLTVKFEAKVESQGLVLKGTEIQKSPNMNATSQTMYAGKKAIAVIKSYFDGNEGHVESSIGGAVKMSADTAADARVSSALFPELNWRTLFKTVSITGKDKIGEEEVYTVEMTPAKGHATIDYVSAKTFRILGRKSGLQTQKEVFSDFRTVDGVLIPYVRKGQEAGLGESVTTLLDVKFDAKIPDSRFKPEVTEREDGTN